jgi:VanZ family protein
LETLEGFDHQTGRRHRKEAAPELNRHFFQGRNISVFQAMQDQIGQLLAGWIISFGEKLPNFAYR